MSKDCFAGRSMNSSTFDALLRSLQLDDVSAAKAFNLPRELISAFRTGQATPAPSVVAEANAMLEGVCGMARSIANSIIEAGPPQDCVCTLSRFRDEAQYREAHYGQRPDQCPLPFAAYTAAIMMVANHLTEHGFEVDFEYMSESNFDVDSGGNHHLIAPIEADPGDAKSPYNSASMMLH